jgi:hypothetical protein
MTPLRALPLRGKGEPPIGYPRDGRPTGGKLPICALSHCIDCYGNASTARLLSWFPIRKETAAANSLYEYSYREVVAIGGRADDRLAADRSGEHLRAVPEMDLGSNSLT